MVNAFVSVERDVVSVLCRARVGMVPVDEVDVEVDPAIPDNGLWRLIAQYESPASTSEHEGGLPAWSEAMNLFTFMPKRSATDTATYSWL